MKLVCVVLNGASGATDDEAIALLNYGFDNFAPLTLPDDDFIRGFAQHLHFQTEQLQILSLQRILPQTDRSSASIISEVPLWELLFWRMSSRKRILPQKPAPKT